MQNLPSFSPLREPAIDQATSFPERSSAYAKYRNITNSCLSAPRELGRPFVDEAAPDISASGQMNAQAMTKYAR
jgi:hypothetical protein